MTLTDVAAVIGMFTGVAALVLNWRTRRDAQLDKRPIVVVVPSKSGATPEGWHRYKVTMRSRANMRYSISKVAVLWPRNVLLAARADIETHVSDNRGGYDIVVHEPANAGRSCRLALEVAPQGAQGYRQPWGGIKMGTREEDHEDFFLSISSSSSSTSFLNLYAWFSTTPHWRKAWLSLHVMDEHAAAKERKVVIALPIISQRGKESMN